MKKIEIKKQILEVAKGFKADIKKYHKTGDAPKTLILRYGICCHLTIAQPYCERYSTSLLRKYFATWKHYSGRDDYPIASNKEKYDEFSYYNEFDNKYRGRQYRMRLKLINHIIKSLKRDINK